ncbi:MAG: endonuclease/exonuclease/phosphatase family protein, partial [Chloroflexota bacterium]|nr:endonuclease/exonuclease/phosphatase family protein [Chloroflexota bacterium]
TWYFLPVLVLLPLALLVRAKRGVLLLLPLLVIGLLRYAPYFVPRAQAQPDAPALRVVTFNTWGGNLGFVDTASYEQMNQWLRETNADIVLLQEIPNSQRQRADGILGLRDVYPQQASTDVQAWTCAMLTRLPVVESASYEPDPRISRPRYQRMVVDFNGQLIAVYNVHIRFPIFAPRRDLPVYVPYVGMLLGYDERERNDEIRYLLRLLEQERLPYVVGGDFNMSDRA